MTFNYYESIEDRINLIDKHGALVKDSDFKLWRLHTNLKAFKKVVKGRTECIANLIIPSGALVLAPWFHSLHIENTGKLRADRAMVHSIVEINTKKKIDFAFSNWDTDFIYRVSDPSHVARALKNQYIPRYECVLPREPLDKRNVECASGIHFFVSLPRAINWK